MTTLPGPTDSTGTLKKSSLRQHHMHARPKDPEFYIGLPERRTFKPDIAQERLKKDSDACLVDMCLEDVPTLCVCFLVFGNPLHAAHCGQPKPPPPSNPGHTGAALIWLDLRLCGVSTSKTDPSACRDSLDFQPCPLALS